jgi:YidC/Oxa1 family membrane protein insertase
MKKEMSMETRWLVFFVLVGAIMLAWPYVMGTAPAPVEKSVPAAKSETPPPAPITTPPSAAEAPPLNMPGQVSAGAEEERTIETKHHRVLFSNRGAVVKSWVLKDFKDSEGKPLDLVNQRALKITGEKAVPPPFALFFKNQTPANNPNDDLFLVTPSEGGLTFEFSDGRISAKKSFQFEEESHLVTVTSQVMENGVLIPHGLVWRGGFGDETVSNVASDAYTLYYDEPSGSLEKKSASDAKDAPQSNSGQYTFAGVEDKYFAAVALPAQGGSLELTTFSDAIPDAEGSDQARVGMAVGGSGANALRFYVGQKDNDLLAMVDPRLEKLIDWGWFGILAKPLFYALIWAYATVTHNYGWAIVLVTIMINLLFVPLRLTQMKSTRKMQAIQPQVNAINAKYKNLPLKDPKRQQSQQEIMELYKREGVNPAGGCLPLLLQIPFFYALYKVLSVSIEMRGADWLWVSDLSRPEALAIRILPILLVVTQFLSQKMTPSPGMDPTQQKMMMFMPLVFGYMFYYASAGLVLYWLTSNVVSIAQQWLLNRNAPTPAPAVIDVTPAPKKKK